MDDMVNKGRSLFGERNHNSKLTEEQIIEIRSMYHSGLFTYKAIGIKFGIDGAHIGSIVRRKEWRHVS